MLTPKKVFKYFILSTLLGVILYMVLGTSQPKLQYTDTNNNQIWDDLEPILDKYAETPEQRRALAFRLKYYQNVLADPELGTVAKKESDLGLSAQSFACLHKTWGENDLDTRAIKDEILSTKARVLAWVKYNGNLSGGTYGLWNEEKFGDPCMF